MEKLAPARISTSHIQLSLSSFNAKMMLEGSVKLSRNRISSKEFGGGAAICVAWQNYVIWNSGRLASNTRSS
jgi:hypothetical protein